MTELLTFQFRAKREDRTDTRVLAGATNAPLMRPAYKRPNLAPSHVATPRAQWGTRAVLMFGPASSDQESRIRDILDAVGLDPWAVFDDDPGRELRYGASVTITPRGNGFMADVALTIPLKVPAPVTN
jgi:hypothetical protein